MSDVTVRRLVKKDRALLQAFTCTEQVKGNSPQRRVQTYLRTAAIAKAAQAPKDQQAAVLEVFDGNTLVGVVALARPGRDQGHRAPGENLSNGERASDALMAAAADHMRANTPGSDPIAFTSAIADTNVASQKVAERHGQRRVSDHLALPGHGLLRRSR